MKTSIGISTKTFDLYGHVLLHDVVESLSDLREYERRLTRNATLDTGAYIDDRGYFPGDRTITVSFRVSQAIFDAVLYILQNYASIWIMLQDGPFSGNLKSLRQRNGSAELVILLESEVT